MLRWFEKYAPIRQKFRAMLVVHGTLAALSLLATIAAGQSPGSLWPVAISAMVLLATLVLVPLFSNLVCKPYVETVVRMEALAAGDLDSPVRYTDHSDCVGRMTRAMAVFASSIRTVRESGAALEQIVGTMRQGLGRLADKDLTFVLNDPLPPEYDQLRLDFNRATEALRETIGSVLDAAHDIHASATEIRAATDDLSNRTEQNAAAIEGTTRAMGEVSTGVQANAGSAGEVNQSVKDVHGEASEGGKIVDRAVVAMQAIQQSAQEISKIVGLIDGIAFQTNLLALNAGVEAARAGEAGKGFAVVATEVRALAQRAADAANAIKQLISTSSVQVQQGVSLVGETGTALAKIVERIGEVHGSVQSIADTASRQATNLAEVNTSIRDMDRMTQQNAAMVEQSTAAARGLANRADELTRLVNAFRTGQSGRNNSQPQGGSFAAPVHRPAAASRPAPRPAAAMPQVSGNLALSSQPEDDWAAF